MELIYNKCLLVATLFASQQLYAQESKPVRVACVGDSITWGSGATSPFQSYPSQFGRMLGEGWLVSNFGNGGATLLKNGDKPYQSTPSFHDALTSHPDIVIIMLGTNDTKAANWVHKDQFTTDYQDLITQFQTLSPKPRIFIVRPSVVVGIGNYGINELALEEELVMIDNLAKQDNIPEIDLHSATQDKGDLFPDKVHPNDAGANLLAKTVYQAVTGKEFTGEMAYYSVSQWSGYTRHDFQVDTRDCILVLPKTALPGNPWIWRTEFFGAYAQADVALLAKGYHVAYMNSQNMYGAPVALDHFDKFYDFLTSQCHLNNKVFLEGFSRGGLYAVNWAARHPDRVAALYLDAPVCDIRSWPGGKGKGTGDKGAWLQLLKLYGMTEEQALTFTSGNPIDNLAPLASAKIPILGICGDADTTVPMDENIMVLQKRYQQLGGEIHVIVKPGVAHHPHSLTDPTPIVTFVMSHTPG